MKCVSCHLNAQAIWDIILSYWDWHTDGTLLKGLLFLVKFSVLLILKSKVTWLTWVKCPSSRNKQLIKKQVVQQRPILDTVWLFLPLPVHFPIAYGYLIAFFLYHLQSRPPERTPTSPLLLWSSTLWYMLILLHILKGLLSALCLAIHESGKGRTTRVYPMHVVHFHLLNHILNTPPYAATNCFFMGRTPRNSFW